MSTAAADGASLLREAWLLRSDKKISKIMLHRKGRLYEDRLELFHLKEGHQPELEQVITLKDASVSEARELEVDVKPRGTNLFFGMVSGDIKSQSAVRPAVLPALLHAPLPSLCPSLCEPAARFAAVLRSSSMAAHTHTCVPNGCACALRRRDVCWAQDHSGARNALWARAPQPPCRVRYRKCPTGLAAMIRIATEAPC